MKNEHHTAAAKVVATEQSQTVSATKQPSPTIWTAKPFSTVAASTPSSTVSATTPSSAVLVSPSTVLETRQPPSGHDSSARPSAEKREDASPGHAPTEPAFDECAAHNGGIGGGRGTHKSEMKANTRPLSPQQQLTLRACKGYSTNDTRKARGSQHVITPASADPPASRTMHYLTPTLKVKRPPAKITATTETARMSAVTTAREDRYGGLSRNTVTSAAAVDKRRRCGGLPPPKVLAVTAKTPRKLSPATGGGGTVKRPTLSRCVSKAAATASDVGRTQEALPSVAVDASTSSPESCELVVVVTPEDESSIQTLARTRTAVLPSARTEWNREKSKTTAAAMEATKEVSTNVNTLPRETTESPGRRKIDGVGAERRGGPAAKLSGKRTSISAAYSPRPSAVRVPHRDLECISAVLEANKPVSLDACSGLKVYSKNNSPFLGHVTRSSNKTSQAASSFSSSVSFRNKYSLTGKINPLPTKAIQTASSLTVKDRNAADQRVRDRISPRGSQAVSSIPASIMDKSSIAESVNPLTTKTPRVAMTGLDRPHNAPRGGRCLLKKLNEVPASGVTPALTSTKGSRSAPSNMQLKASAATSSITTRKRQPRGHIAVSPACHSDGEGGPCPRRVNEETKTVSRVGASSSLLQSTGGGRASCAKATALGKHAPTRLDLSLRVTPYTQASEVTSTSDRQGEGEGKKRGLFGGGAEEEGEEAPESGGVGGVAVRASPEEENSVDSSSAKLPLLAAAAAAERGLAHSQSWEWKPDTLNNVTTPASATSSNSSTTTSAVYELNEPHDVENADAINELHPNSKSGTHSTSVSTNYLSAAPAAVNTSAADFTDDEQSTNSADGISESVSDSKVHTTRATRGSSNSRASFPSAASASSSDSTRPRNELIKLRSIPTSSPQEPSTHINSTIAFDSSGSSAAALTKDCEQSQKTAHARTATAAVGGGGGDGDGDDDVGIRGGEENTTVTNEVRYGAGDSSIAKHKSNKQLAASTSTSNSLAVPGFGYYRRRPTDNSNTVALLLPSTLPLPPAKEKKDGERGITITTADHDHGSRRQRRRLQGLSSEDRNDNDDNDDIVTQRSSITTSAATTTTLLTTTVEYASAATQPLLVAEMEQRKEEEEEVEEQASQQTGEGGTAPRYRSNATSAGTSVSSASSLSEPLAYRQLLRALESALNLAPQASSCRAAAPSEETDSKSDLMQCTSSLSSSVFSPSPHLSPAQEGDFSSDSIQQLRDFWTPLPSRRNSVAIVAAESSFSTSCDVDGGERSKVEENRGRIPEALVATGSEEKEEEEEEEEEDEDEADVVPVFFRDRRPSAVYFTSEKKEGFPWLTWAFSVHPDQQELQPSPHDKLEAVRDPNYILDLILNVGEVIGQGQYGTVYEARLRSPQSTTGLGRARGRDGNEKGGGASKGRNQGQRGEMAMALKKLQKISQETTVHALAEQRALLIGRECPFIVKMFSCFQTKLAYYILLEMAEGGSLTDVLKDAGRLPEQNLRFFAAQLMAALSFLHDRDVLHRDLKVDNVLMDAVGYVRLCDFGLSMDEFRDDDQVCSPCGTLFYVAPEVMRGEPYSKTADWWSYGVLMYQLATGTLPFEGMNIQALYIGVTRKEPLYPSFLSASVVSFIKKMLTKNHGKRPGNSAQQREALKKDPFFHSIDWPALFERSLVPPALPKHRLCPSSQHNYLTADTDVVLSASLGVLYEREQQAAKQTRSRSLDPSGLFDPISIGDEGDNS